MFFVVQGFAVPLLQVYVFPKIDIMKSIITVIAFLLISQFGFCNTQDYTKLDDFFKVLEENDRFFGSVAVTRNGEVIYSKAIGYADIETNTPNTKETKFRIGSTTKTFTATLTMKAVEMGEINLDDTIDEYFPKIQNADKITIHHLLNHRSGINTFTDREYFSWYTKPITKTDLLDKIISKGIDFEPNAKYVYSNSNYVLLTFILEDVFKQSYAQILQKYIVKPLGLKNTNYGGKINTAQKEAKSYRMKTEWEIEPEGDMSIPLGAGGIISTPTDLCHFATALFGGKLISAQSLEQMKPLGDDSYGFGLEGTPIDDRNGWGHPGVIDAFTSTLAYFEEDDLCIALICNGSNYGNHDVAIAVLSEISGKPYELPNFEFVELSSEELDPYLGTYETDELPMDITISKEESTLLLKVTGQSASPLTAEGNHKFSIMKYGVKITFIPSEKKMQFEQQGMKFDFTMQDSSKSVESTNEDLDQYLGVYESDQLPMDLTITKEGDKLFGQGTGQDSFPLESEGNHIFSNKQIGLSITFMPDEKKLVFEQGGAKFEMTKKAVESSSEELDQYLGIYTSDQLPIDLTISKEGDQLFGKGEGQPNFQLKSEGNHVFSNKEIGLKITFFPDEKKMSFEQGGAKFEMKVKE